MGKTGTYTLVQTHRCAHTQAWYLTRSVIDTGLDLENHCHSSLCRSNSHIISHKGKRDGGNKRGREEEGGGKACSSVKCFLVFHKRRAISLKTHPSLSSMKQLHVTSQETDAGVRPPVTPAVNMHMSLLISERGTNKSYRRFPPGCFHSVRIWSVAEPCSDWTGRHNQPSTAALVSGYFRTRKWRSVCQQSGNA